MSEHPSSDESVKHLFDLLDCARWYVQRFEPTSSSEAYDQGHLLMEIDAALPAPASTHPLCDEAWCCREKGHEGAHDDIPF